MGELGAWPRPSSHEPAKVWGTVNTETPSPTPPPEPDPAKLRRDKLFGRLMLVGFVILLLIYVIPTLVNAPH